MKTFEFSEGSSRAKYRRNFNSPPPPPVLRSFQIQQTGSAIRVIDADGSIYEGSVTPRPAVNAIAAARNGSADKRLAQRRELSTRDSSETQISRKAGEELERNVESSTLFFRVSGTNQSLNQVVVLTGQLRSRVNSPGDRLGIADNGGIEMQGKAKVGQGTELSVNAVGRRP